MENTTALQVNNLVTTFTTEKGKIRAVDDVSFTLKKGHILGLVGESGCGKTVTALSILRLLPKPTGNIDHGTILFDDKDITRLSPDELYKIRGNNISMIFQEPMTALNPVHKIKNQLGEIYKLHFPDLKKDEIIEKSIKLLTRVGIPDASKIMNEYPHQLSGGMRQRIMIAMALSCNPKILIADEPTTALDVTIQAQILDLILELQKENDMSIIFITHDLGVIAEICRDVVVMYAGKIAEIAPVNEIFTNPRHPYTVGLISSIPKLENKRKVRLNTIKGMVPSLHDLPNGCRFNNRCPKAKDQCFTHIPELTKITDDHYASCFYI